MKSLRKLTRSASLSVPISCVTTACSSTPWPQEDIRRSLGCSVENYSAVQNQRPTRHAILDYLANEKVPERIFGAF